MYFKEAAKFKKIHFKNEWIPICCCLQTLTAPDLSLDTQCLSDRPVLHDLSREKSTCLSSIRQLRCNLILFFDRKMNGFQFQCPSKRLWVARKRGACEIKVSRRTVRSVTSYSHLAITRFTFVATLSSFYEQLFLNPATHDVIKLWISGEFYTETVSTRKYRRYHALGKDSYLKLYS